MEVNFDIEQFIWLIKALEIICLIVSMRFLLVKPNEKRSKIIRLILISVVILLNAVQLPIEFRQNKFGGLIIPWIIFLLVDACIILYDLPDSKDE